ncbi:MAG: glycerol-3-phosphate dehydrogenase/oxidase [Sediminibacterium sp.]|nr:glycerol-3-phosphate dehydrogenase/oxidase [Sediminibacterium sp.]
MNRSTMLAAALQQQEFDVVIIGGGATGLGAALDAATRGCSTLLVEQFDFGKGTSSRSTKLVHGGVRYLAQGNIKLVREALRERGFLLKNAPTLTSTQPFVVPVFGWWEKIYYTLGLMFYDLMSGKLSLGKTHYLNKKQTIQHLPTINPRKLKGGILYYDGQFNDSALCAALAVTAAAKGAVLLNYTKATGFIKEKGIITGVQLEDQLGGRQLTVKAKAVINATGVFTDAVLNMDEDSHDVIVAPSQGIHLVIDPVFFPGKDALMIPKTDDGRVLFAVPWQNKVVLGTTDTPVDTIEIEPRPLGEEIEFILEHFNRYTSATVRRSDVQSVFVGLRPLVRANENASTALLSRDHTLVVAPSRLVTITGGKWTTYRKMAEDAVNNALFVSKQKDKSPCITRELPIGNDAEKQCMMQEWIAAQPALAARLHPAYPFTRAELVYAVRNEMAMTVEDFLARRIRLLFLDARAAVATAPAVAEIMAAELHQPDSWASEQVNLFNELAQQYILA